MSNPLWPDLSRLRQYDRLIWRAMWGLALLACALVGGYYFYGSKAGNGAANWAFAHAGGPLDDEKPATADVPLVSSIEMAALGGRGEGISCSLPAATAWAFRDGPPPDPDDNAATPKSRRANASLQFRQACLKHDLCYRHGAATYGYTQAQCDNFLAEDAFRICRQIYDKDSSQDWCRTQARKVLGGVTLGGAAAFRSVGIADELFQVRDPKRRDDQLSVSTYLEYDPYPVGSARYYAPRLLDVGADSEFQAEPNCKADTKVLVTYWRRGGGGRTTYRCLRQVGESWTLISLPSSRSNPATEVDFRPTAPVIADDDGLKIWCRREDDSKPTDGRIMRYPAQAKPDWFGGCKQLPSETEGPPPSHPQNMFDPDTASVFFLPRIENQLYDIATLYPHDETRPGHTVCQVRFRKAGNTVPHYSVELPNAAGPDSDCYRWTVTAPQFIARDDGRIDALFFRRGESDGAGYATKLDVSRITLAADGTISPATPLMQLELGEEDEPFVAVPQGESGIALLSINRYKPATTQNFFFGIGIGGIAALLIVIVVFNVLGRGYAALTTVGALAFFAYQFMSRDDVARGNLLPGSIAIRLQEVAPEGKAQNFIWREESTQPLSPAHFMQNRMSVVRNADGSLRLIGTHFQPQPSFANCPLQPTLAIIRLRPPQGGANDWQVEVGRSKITALNKVGLSGTKCEQYLVSAISKFASIPFRDKEGKLHMLVVQPATAGTYEVSGDIDSGWTDAQTLLPSD